MLQYILETIAFQLVFLLTYDLFLKKETFFQWNRAYLLGTFSFSFLLPLIKLEALSTTITQESLFYPVYLWQLDPVTIAPTTEPSFWELLTVTQWILVTGSVVMILWLINKLFRIQQLKQNGLKKYFPNFTKVVVENSEVAFSFFKNVFLGDGISKEKEPQILAHELVHIKQWHSLDLLFFELFRIVFWFNPLVYVYQNRIAELHEFIADAQAAKANKNEQYQLLLSEVFQTQQLSFVNQFFKKSLLKKRIVMLQKQKSKAVYQLKYVMLLPLVFGMLIYSSCKQETNEQREMSLADELAAINEEIRTKDSLTASEINEITKMAETMVQQVNKSPKTVNGWEVKTGLNISGESALVPFGVIEEVPIYPGCENAMDKKACFMENLNEHIRKHFNYPQQAQEMGIQGRVAVMFTIDTNGSITDIKKRGPHELLENEVERIIKRLPQMQPGKQNGEAVNVPFSVPVNFVLK